MLSYLFLKAKGNASDGALRDSLHQVGGEASNLVSKSLGLDHCNVVDDSLIYMEIVGQPKHDKKSGRHLLSVVLLDKCSGGSLNGLGSDSSLKNNINRKYEWFDSNHLPLLINIMLFINN